MWRRRQPGSSLEREKPRARQHQGHHYIHTYTSSLLSQGYHLGGCGELATSSTAPTRPQRTRLCKCYKNKRVSVAKPWRQHRIRVGRWVAVHEQGVNFSIKFYCLVFFVAKQTIFLCYIVCIHPAHLDVTKAVLKHLNTVLPGYYQPNGTNHVLILQENFIPHSQVQAVTLGNMSLYCKTCSKQLLYTRVPTLCSKYILNCVYNIEGMHHSMCEHIKLTQSSLIVSNAMINTQRLDTYKQNILQ